MIIHKITTSVDYNYWLKYLDTQLNGLINQNLIEVPKIVKQIKLGTVRKNSLKPTAIYVYANLFKYVFFPV